MSSSTASVIALILNFSGTVFLLLDSIRTAGRLKRDGIILSDLGSRAHWSFQYAATLGFGLLFLSFVFQTYAILR